jgi:hypothetical protein
VYLCVTFSDIACLYGYEPEQINASFIFTNLHWWYDNDHDTWPENRFESGDIRPLNSCRWGYWDPTLLVFGDLTFLIIGQETRLLLSSWGTSIRYFFTRTSGGGYCSNFVTTQQLYCGPSTATISLGSC